MSFHSISVVLHNSQFPTSTVWLLIRMDQCCCVCFTLLFLSINFLFSFLTATPLSFPCLYLAPIFASILLIYSSDSKISTFVTVVGSKKAGSTSVSTWYQKNYRHSLKQIIDFSSQVFSAVQEQYCQITICHCLSVLSRRLTFFVVKYMNLS